MDRYSHWVLEGEQLSFLEGNNPDYPIAAMQEDFVELRSKLEDMRNDPTTPDTVRIEQPLSTPRLHRSIPDLASVWQRLSDNPNPFNPCLDYLETLVALMCGGTRPVYFRPLHLRLHYFDPEARRPGVPPDVGALVDGLENLGRHLRNIGQFGVPAVVAINKFVSDTPAEIDAIHAYCKEFGVEVFDDGVFDLLLHFLLFVPFVEEVNDLGGFVHHCDH